MNSLYASGPRFSVWQDSLEFPYCSYGEESFTKFKTKLSNSKGL